MNFQSSEIAPAKILIVDDVEANLQVVRRRLACAQFDLHSVKSGAEALRFIQEHKPDLVLLDFMMPEMNGIEVLNVIRKEWELAELPVIMLTARAESAALISGLEAGADDYISKPIDFSVLKARIETQLSKVKSKKSLRQVNTALDERVTMRALAFDQLREELENEITLRRKAERELDRLTMDSDNTGAAAPEGVEKTAVDVQPLVEIVDRIIRAVSDGKPVNQALLSSLKFKLLELG